MGRQNESLVGLIGAMSIEMASLLMEMQEKREQVIAGISFYQGLLYGVPCVVACSGAGKVNAAVCGQSMVMAYAPGALLNLGVAGGIGPALQVGDLVVGTACVQYDFDTSGLGDPPGELVINRVPVTRFPCDPVLSEILQEAGEEIYGQVHRGIIATGDRFVADARECAELYRRFGALACEMEGGSIAHLCYMNRLPMAVLRAVSDGANDSAPMDFETFAKEAAAKTQTLMKTALPRLAREVRERKV